MRKKKPHERARYLDAQTRHRLLNHKLALQDIRKEISYHEEQLVRVAYKQRATSRDLGKIYKALNTLRSLSSIPERDYAAGTLRGLKLTVDEVER